MLAISVELLHGTFRGASADDTAFMGVDGDSGEWPPSPARLFAALVAGDGTGNRQRVTNGSELFALEAADAPAILADPPDRVVVSRVLDRFVVVNERYQDPKSGETRSVQEYVGRNATSVRAGVRRAPSRPVVVYLWRELTLTDEQAHGIRARAARVGYLGCADSPVRIKVATKEAPGWDESRSWEPDDSGPTTLPVPWPGLVSILDQAFERWSAGEDVRKAWLPTRLGRYRPPGTRIASAPPPTVLWLRFGTPVSGRRVLAVTGTLRDAVLQGYERWVAGSPEAVPSVLHGHGYRGTGGQHVHWLALPDVGSRYSRGRIHGAAVWFPPATDPAVVEGVRDVLWRTRTLVRPGVFETDMRLSGDEESRPLAANPDRWRGPASTWVSAFPVVHERWQPKGPDLSEVARWCRHAGIAAEPILFRSWPVPLVEGSPSLRPDEVHREGRERRPYSHIEVEFAEPVPGPIVLGRGRQFGLGLMAPPIRGWKGAGLG
jgi:CRISPR-associated protein Csb2